MNKNNFLPRFLFHSRYRIWRHMILLLILAIITFNQVFIAYQDSQPVLGSRIYLICLACCAACLSAMYFNYFYLTPNYLLKGRYTIYVTALCILVFILPTLSVAGEYGLRNSLELPHRITSYTNPLILVDSLATSFITLICICGVSVIKLFRELMQRNEQVGRLEKEHIQSELNKLKGQIAPAFLSQTLRGASSLAKATPQKSSDMLMKLGQLLRYQLYDCNRDRVLLKSEINALNKYFELEQLSHPDIQYHIRVEGDIKVEEGTNNVFVSPMLFMSLVQCMVTDSTLADVNFNLKDETLTFRCKADGNQPLDDAALSLVRQRLELQYPDRYTLQSNPGMLELQLKLDE
ncbi:histidine kinase [uncultured Bacteroides sp.]|uniref:histidine kinase n=1 Tax=uncultured Bacteroides sp. TaxID=162156 RepID=UPI00280B66EE|nr:histidine kinase [uncultured Bacteroides sp.]